MDNFTYYYLSGTNKLSHIADNVPSSRSSYDIDDQQSNNYEYDLNGNMIQDLENWITNVTYDYRNLPISMIKNGDTIFYRYDANGNRVFKATGSGANGTYYINDATGKTIALIDAGNNLKLNIWGLDNIGMMHVIHQTTYIPPDPNCGAAGSNCKCSSRINRLIITRAAGII